MNNDFDNTTEMPVTHQDNQYQNDYQQNGYGQNNNYPQNNYPQNNYVPNNYMPNNYNGKKQGNTGLVVAVSILASVLIIAIVFATLYFTGVISFGGNQTDAWPDTSGYNDSAANPSSSPTSADKIEKVKPVPVEKYMYVGNCKKSVTLRAGASTGAAEIRQVPLADQIYVIEYTNSSFARVVHNGTEGYIMRDYIVTQKPEVWNYNDYDAETQVANSVRAFVNGINTGDTSYVYTYFANSAATQELKSHESIRAVAESEEILSLNCHSVERKSASESY